MNYKLSQSQIALWNSVKKCVDTTLKGSELIAFVILTFAGGFIAGIVVAYFIYIEFAAPYVVK